MRDSLLEVLEASITDASDVHIGETVDAHSFLAGLAADLRANTCEPFPVSAIVVSPGFPGKTIGSTISCMCVAQRAGYWLVYHAQEARFYCFWGTDISHLGAHGVSGSPLYCWSA